MRIIDYLKKYYPFSNFNKYYYNNHKINQATDNSKDVRKNDVYFHFCQNEHYEYIEDAISRGAKSIFVSKDCNYQNDQNVNIIKVENPKVDIARMNNDLYLLKYTKYPIMIGVTGTCGKTTSSMITFELLKKFGKDVLYIGSNGIYVYYGKSMKYFTNFNTTPSNSVIYKYLNQNEMTYDYVIIEVSSQALSDFRVMGIKFDYSLITNFFKEHLEYYQDEKEYLEAKKSIIFQTTKNVIINHDIKYFDSFIKNIYLPYTTFGLQIGDFQAKVIDDDFEVNKFIINYQNKKILLKSNMLGEFNVYNLLGVFSLFKTIGYSDDLIINGLSDIKSIPGRMNLFKYKNRTILVDYAHSHLAYINVMKYLQKVAKKNLIVVVGAGGLRNKENRSFIGKITTLNSYKVIFTEDNSRTEDVKNIIDEITKDLNVTNYIVEYDRKNAIDLAISISKEEDIIAILGKGNEDFIISKTIKKFNDLEYVKSLIRNDES